MTYFCRVHWQKRHDILGFYQRSPTHHIPRRLYTYTLRHCTQMNHVPGHVTKRVMTHCMYPCHDLLCVTWPIVRDWNRCMCHDSMRATWLIWANSPSASVWTDKMSTLPSNSSTAVWHYLFGHDSVRVTWLIAYRQTRHLQVSAGHLPILPSNSSKAVWRIFFRHDWMCVTWHIAYQQPRCLRASAGH